MTVKALKFNGGFRQVEGKLQIWFGKLIHNDVYIVRGRCNELLGQFIKYSHAKY